MGDPWGSPGRPWGAPGVPWEGLGPPRGLPGDPPGTHLGPSWAPWASRGGSGRLLASQNHENPSILLSFSINFRCRNRWQIWLYVLRCWYRSRCRNGFGLRFWTDGFVDSVVAFRFLAGSRFDGANDEADGNTDATTRCRDGGANAEADGTNDATTRCSAA